MPKEIIFHAISIDSSIPIEIKRFFGERLDVKAIFGKKCYVILEDDEFSPLNLLDEEFRGKVERWLATVQSEQIFSYAWIPHRT